MGKSRKMLKSSKRRNFRNQGATQWTSPSSPLNLMNIDLGASNSKPAIKPTPQPLSKENNPMKVDLVLEVLFGFCPASTLRNCRLVCKQWRDVSLQAWRNKAILSLSKELEEASVKDCLLYLTGSDKKMHQVIVISNRMRRVLDKNKAQLQLEKYPFRNFLIETSLEEYTQSDRDFKSFTDNSRHLTLENIKRGFRIFPDFLIKLQKMESLELRNCDWKWKEGPEKVVLQNMMSLKILFDGLHREGSHVPKESFFQHFPNLKTLSLDYRTMASSSLDEITCIFQLLRYIRLASVAELAEAGTVEGFSMPMNLEELEIINLPTIPTTEASNKFWKQNFKTEFIMSVVECTFPLKRLSMDLHFTGKIRPVNMLLGVGRLLHVLNESLEYLRLSFRFDMDLFIDRITSKGKDDDEKRWKLRIALKEIRMVFALLSDGICSEIRKLKELQLGNGIWAFYFLLHLKLPSLEKLTVDYGKHEKRKVNILDYQVHRLEGTVFPKLETFELSDIHEIPRPETMKVFANTMPNLCALTCPLDKEAFKIVCEKFNGLKTLNILGAQCKYSELEDETLTGVPKEGHRGGERPPNITNLAGLKDIKISSDCMFTDHSVTHGFLQLQNLVFLTAAFEKISYGTKVELLGHAKGSVKFLEKERMDLFDGESDENPFADDMDSSSSDEEKESDASDDEDEDDQELSEVSDEFLSESESADSDSH